MRKQTSHTTATLGGGLHFAEEAGTLTTGAQVANQAKGTGEV